MTRLYSSFLGAVIIITIAGTLNGWDGASSGSTKPTRMIVAGKNDIGRGFPNIRFVLLVITWIPKDPLP